MLLMFFINRKSMRNSTNFEAAKRERERERERDESTSFPSFDDDGVLFENFLSNEDKRRDTKLPTSLS